MRVELVDSSSGTSSWSALLQSLEAAKLGSAYADNTDAAGENDVPAVGMTTQIYETMDADQNGRVTEDEHKAFTGTFASETGTSLIEAQASDGEEAGSDESGNPLQTPDSSESGDDYQALASSKSSALLVYLDANHDGYIDEGEARSTIADTPRALAASGDYSQQMVNRLLSEVDSNGDGTLSDDEIASAVAQIREHSSGARENVAVAQVMMKGVDQDGDQGNDDSEKQAGTLAQPGMSSNASQDVMLAVGGQSLTADQNAVEVTPTDAGAESPRTEDDASFGGAGQVLSGRDEDRTDGGNAAGVQDEGASLAGRLSRDVMTVLLEESAETPA